ncbi:hypothetical protein SOCE26_011260 [Sorangium cellulosum]|uniref:Uncharacterized protein n=1 Tax=Sorangium cellulosum TaxID=56 RepID=A0A2L0EKB3_SORCE|nr:hypothetical protein [Sorangium cellulosum]AUX39731.1 hypothetical protein SOCE26_011260 [Sorangium cellulosum]
MEEMLGAMWLVSPLGLAMMACVAIGFAVTAREALGRERGLREAAEQKHGEDEAALIAAKTTAERELGRHQRLLDCHIDALIAAATDVRARPVPWPGRVLEAFCATRPGWQRKLAENTGLEPRDVDRLLNSDLPMTPGLARQLETFTGTPARYWERLWRMHDDYRTDVEETEVIKRNAAIIRPESAARPAASPALISVPPSSPAIPPRALDVPSPVVPSLEVAAKSPRARLPPPPEPRLRSPAPVRAAAGAELACRAASLTSFPLQQGDGRSTAVRGPDWEDVERLSLSTTLPGVGSDGAA